MRHLLVSGVIALALPAAGALADDVPTFDVGALTLHGEPQQPVPEFGIGTLTLHGSVLTIPSYDVGTLVLHGNVAPMPSYDVGTLKLRGSGLVAIGGKLNSLSSNRLRHP